MRLPCQRAFLLLVVSAIACNDATGPVSLPAQFELVNINGRALPTPLAFTPGLTPTILSASLRLDDSGRVVMTENRTLFDGTPSTSTLTLDYKINGNDIEVGCLRGAPITCVSTHFTGTISRTTLSLTMVAVSIDGSITYNYRLAGR
jgi:hypothetical protein